MAIKQAEEQKTESTEQNPIENGLVLYTNEKGSPAIAVIGEVSLQEITAYTRLLNITEEQSWKKALNSEQTEDEE